MNKTCSSCRWWVPHPVHMNKVGMCCGSPPVPILINGNLSSCRPNTLESEFCPIHETKIELIDNGHIKVMSDKPKVPRGSL